MFLSSLRARDAALGRRVEP